MKKSMIVSLIALSAFTMNGCGDKLKKSRITDTIIAKPAVSSATIVGQDESDSCKNLQCEFNECRARLVEGSQGGESWMTILINSKGYADSNYLENESGDIPKDTSILKYELKAKTKKLAEKIRAHQSQIDNIGTDLYGFLYFAETLLKSKSGKRSIVIFSDMDDTLGKRRDIDLHGITVYCLYVAHPKGDISNWEKKVAYWTDFFGQMGAKKIVILDPAQSGSFKLN